jgi:hypothetical protein
MKNLPNRRVWLRLNHRHRMIEAKNKRLCEIKKKKKQIHEKTKLYFEIVDDGTTPHITQRCIPLSIITRNIKQRRFTSLKIVLCLVLNLFFVIPLCHRFENFSFQCTQFFDVCCQLDCSFFITTTFFDDIGYK